MSERTYQFLFDTSHLGELIYAVLLRYAEANDIEPPRDQDEWRDIMRHAISYCVYMADRANMRAETTLDDLHALPETEEPSAPLSSLRQPTTDNRRLSDRERAAKRKLLP